MISFDTSVGGPGSPAPLVAIVGLIGPGFSGETKATMPKFEEAGLPMITPGATNALLSTNGWTMFHRILANDDKQAPGVVKLISETLGATKVGVIDDASEYGKGLADSVRAGLGDLDVADAQIDPKAADYSAAIEAMKSAGVDTVFYGGYYAEAAKLVQQMRDAGLEATFVSGDGALDKAFVENAGPAAEGAYLTATGAPSDRQRRVPGCLQRQVRHRPGPVLARGVRLRQGLPRRHRRRQRHPRRPGRLRVGLRRPRHHQADQVRCDW